MIRSDFVVKGLPKALAKIDGLSGPALKRTAKKSLSSSGRAILAPAIAQNTPHRYGGHGGKYPTKGLLAKRQKITARGVPLRSGEIAAVSIKPRLWFEHFVAGGTKAHFIGPTDAKALSFGGKFVAGVQHPGAKASDYIHTAAQGQEQAVLDRLAEDLIKSIS